MSEVGSDEAEHGIFRVKNLKTREEKRLSLEEFVAELKK